MKKYVSRIAEEVTEKVEDTEVVTTKAIESVKSEPTKAEVNTEPVEPSPLPEVKSFNTDNEVKEVKERVIEVEGIMPKNPDEVTPTSVTLTNDNRFFLEIRSNQLGITKKDYLNILIGEYITKNDDIGNMEIFKTCKEKFKTSKSVMNVQIANEYLESLTRACAMRGMNKSMYLNYIIDCEIEKEKNGTPRKGKYDI